MHDAATHFAAAIRAAGLTPPEVIQSGKFHRFPGSDKGRGDDAGWCKLFEDGRGGVFGDFSTGLDEHWQAETEHVYSAEERQAFRQRCEAERLARDAELLRQHEAAANNAVEILAAANDDPTQHPYALKKAVDFGPRVKRGAWPQRNWDDALLIPLYGEDGKIWTLEAINADGQKDYLKGGRKRGSFHPLGKISGANRLLISEGLANAAVGRAVDGAPAVAAMDTGNLTAVALAVRKLAPDAEIIFLADNDIKQDGSNPGLQTAIEAAQAVGGRVAVPELDERKCDFWDLWHERGPDAVANAVNDVLPKTTAQADVADNPPCCGNKNPSATLETTVDAACGVVADKMGGVDEHSIFRLAALSPIEYDRVRTSEAEKLGIRSVTLDKLVIAARKSKSETNAGIDFELVEPWEHPIDPAQLLTDISTTVRRFIVCQPETADAVALWAAMTWFMDVVQIAPLAVITAPEKRCGKSQLLFLLGKLSCKPLTASNISPAALFRAIDAWKPTLLVDEADAFMKDNEELRGLLNCGHTRDSAYIVRVVGDDFTPTKFSVWGAKAIAGIGHLADTLMDRAITLELRRKLPSESVERLRYAEPGLFDDLAAKLARFADDYRESVRLARPELPISLNDRAQDNWEPLLAIAEVAGGNWPGMAKNAALKLSGTDSPTQSMGTELLSDIQEIFETKRIDKISTADLIAWLCEDDEKSWATYNRGKQISPRQIAKCLDKYGIKSKTIRINNYSTPKGFEKEQFSEAFSRYLFTPQKSATPQQTTDGAVSSVADGFLLPQQSRNPPQNSQNAQPTHKKVRI